MFADRDADVAHLLTVRVDTGVSLLTYAARAIAPVGATLFRGSAVEVAARFALGLTLAHIEKGHELAGYSGPACATGASAAVIATCLDCGALCFTDTGALGRACFVTFSTRTAMVATRPVTAI